MNRRSIFPPFAVEHVSHQPARITTGYVWARIVAACWWLAIPLFAIPALWPFYGKMCPTDNHINLFSIHFHIDSAWKFFDDLTV